MIRFGSLTMAAVAALMVATSLPVLAEETPAKPAMQAHPAIVVTPTTTRSLTDKAVTTGTIRAVDEVYIQPMVDGLSIRALNVDVGDRVEAGSTLAVLNDDALLLQKSQFEANKAKAEAGVAQYRAQVIEAEANLKDAVSQRDRLVRLGKNGTASTSQVEQAVAAADVAEARLQAARQAVTVGQADIKVVDSQIADTELKLARTAVKTPVSGIVAAKNAKVGAIASGAGEPLFTVIEDGALELVADVAEGDILRIKTGQKATIALAGSRDVLPGSVRLISPTIDPVTRLGTVHIALDDSGKARAGMYGSATVVIDTADALALPLTAILTGSDGETTARKIENDTVKQVKVTTGIQDGPYIQIVSGLQSGDEVVAKAGAYVRDGDKITPVRDAAQTN
ncbi:efflux RND transporter periplasmic adaptor subunit [Rhizobium sp. YJ-22]|uniref:efflux RND transporter periplasmic adaptor subunit n=1 Tax=Rhizobium sp. YJ-22 TaxID=3037556 RepID=UPI0024129C9A|nr:efflux RND transporter periplasmic adaptor subunit [Rhizobium sp. YJ-22]MDG3576251.1 efflux RND transporter periplasmic adaptor subunit [Rhizobium sp. YJ-22]